MGVDRARAASARVAGTSSFAAPARDGGSAPTSRAGVGSARSSQALAPKEFRFSFSEDAGVTRQRPARAASATPSRHAATSQVRARRRLSHRLGRRKPRLPPRRRSRVRAARLGESTGLFFPSRHPRRERPSRRAPGPLTAPSPPAPGANLRPHDHRAVRPARPPLGEALDRLRLLRRRGVARASPRVVVPPVVHATDERGPPPRRRPLGIRLVRLRRRRAVPHALARRRSAPRASSRRALRSRLARGVAPLVSPRRRGRRDARRDSRRRLPRLDGLGPDGHIIALDGLGLPQQQQGPHPTRGTRGKSRRESVARDGHR